ncbi:MAG TPA: pitrilysin family protein, partial [Pyrinomonadaceae bacterium]|nr:pitrilysin family protein [Pyrinomonadaceae bacterium]
MVRKSTRFLAMISVLVAAQFTASAQTRMPQMKFSDRTLPNGMRVLSAADSSSPTVAIQVWYHVGSKDDPQKRSGFAHLFEHIMFKSTKNMKSEMMDRLTEDVGGFNNAFTADDVTVYFEVVPSNYLETLLWAEADRLSGLNVDDPNFKSERDVVKEEYRQGVLAPPYGRFEYLLQERSFSEHPYKRPGIGSIEDLDAASLKDVQEFHTTYYRPDNATLV